MRKRSAVSVLVLGWWCWTAAGAALAGEPFFTGVGDLPGGEFMSEAWGVSADGRVVVGRSGSLSEGGSYEAFRWTREEGIVGLGFLPGAALSRSLAKAASADGSVIVGWSKSENTVVDGTTEAFRWTPATGMIGLGDLPGANFDSDAWGVSGDGSVITGYGNVLIPPSPYSIPETYVWTAAEGMVGLGNLSGDPFFSLGRAVSADGSTIVGQSDESDECPAMAFRWTSSEGMVRLGDFPGGSCWSLARGVSQDGAVIVGTGWSDLSREACLWTAQDGPVGLGDLPGGYDYGEAWAVSADGAVVVGLSSTTAGERAFVWDAEHGMRNLRDVLVNETGLDLTGWTLKEARGISANGRTIVGIGTNPDGYAEGWVAYLGGTCLGDLNGDGLRNLADLAALLGAYGGGAGGDLDGDGDTDLQDLASLLSVYGLPCP